MEKKLWKEWADIFHRTIDSGLELNDIIGAIECFAKERKLEGAKDLEWYFLEEDEREKKVLDKLQKTIGENPIS